MRLEQESVKRKPLLRTSADDARLTEKEPRIEKEDTHPRQNGDCPNRFVVMLLRALYCRSARE